MSTTCPPGDLGEVVRDSAESEKPELEASVAPNPMQSAFILYLRSKNEEIVEIVVMDFVGRPVYHTRGSSNADYQFGGTFTTGIYIVQVRHQFGVKVPKVIKE